MMNSCVTRQNAYWNAVEPRDRRLVAGRARRTCVVSALPDTGSREHVRFPEGFVGGDDHAGPLVTGGDQLEEQVGGLGLEGDIADLATYADIDVG